MSTNPPQQAKIIIVQYPGFTPTTTLSPPCGKVHMALAFKKLDYEVLALSSPTQVKRYNPRGRLPVLSIDDELIVDSSDILTELDRRFLHSPMLPEEPIDRARASMLEDWADEVLYFYDVWYRWLDPRNAKRMKREVLAHLPIPFRWLVPPLAAREVRRRARGQGIGLKEPAAVRREYRECLDCLVELLRYDDYLVAGRMTRADFAVCAVLDQLRIPRLTPDAAAEIDARPEVVAWLERIHRHIPNAVTGERTE